MNQLAEPVKNNTPVDRPLIVGVGASAGGLEAFTELMSGVGDNPGFAIVFVQHLDPNNKSLLGELLRQKTSLPIEEIQTRKKIKPDTVYLCPPRGRLVIRDDMLVVSEKADDDSDSNTIDTFFHSIAETQGERGIGIILSGSGSDGTLGLKSISDAGGMTFAQDSGSAKFDSMPRNAATTGVADQVMPPVQIAAEVLKYVRYLGSVTKAPTKKNLEEKIKNAIPQIADSLLAETGHNFKHYKTSTLARRIQRRMQILKLAAVDDYVTLLQEDKNESQQLFRDLLISVTAFFRDPESFDRLADEVIPTLFANRKPDDPIRIWIPGCATGEEAYTMAILFREYLDRRLTAEAAGDGDDPEPACSVDNSPSFQIFASDIDDRALGIARAGIYPAGIADHVSEERLKRFFVKKGKRYHVTSEIRETVLFSRHNLISDPPFSRQDLISCRNLLIYLGPHLQKKLIPLFHFALRPGGFLFLGPSETISTHGDLFRPVDQRHRISQRKGTAIGRGAALAPRSPSGGMVRPPEVSPIDDDNSDVVQIMQRIILDEFAPKSVVVDEDGQVICSSAETNKYLSIGDGKFQNNILKMARRGLRIGLRVTLGEAKSKRRRIVHENLAVQTDEGKQRVMITVQPMMRLGEDSGLFIIVFHDVGLPMGLSENPDKPVDPNDVLIARGSMDRQAEAMIEQLERELATTRDDLEKTMQEIEAANEELKSSNEELLSMNEELQSANEELETSKEEIRAGSEAVMRANTDLENLLRSIRIATIFLDDELCIRSFTPAATDIYSLIPTDTGRPLAQIVPNVESMSQLPSPQSLVHDEPIEETVTTRDGQTYIRRVLPYQDERGATSGMVVTFPNVTPLKDSQELFQLLVEASSQIVWITSPEGFVTEDSPTWRAFTGQTVEQWLGHGWLDAIHPDDRDATMTQWQHVVHSGEPLSLQYRLQHTSGRYRWMQINAVAQRNPDGSVKRWVGMNIDIDEQKSAQQSLLESKNQLAEAKERLELSLEVSGVATWNWNMETDSVISNPALNRMFGFDPDENLTVGKFISQMDESVQTRVSAAIDDAVKNGGTYDQEYPIRLRNGQLRHVRAVGKVQRADAARPQQFFGVVLDVTARRSRELETAEREAHLRRVINNQLGLVGVIDRDGTLLEVDERSLEIAKTRRDEVIGKHFADAPWWTYDPAVAQGTRDAMARAFAGEVVRYDVSLFAHGDDGVLIDFMIAPVKNHDGEVEYLIPSGVDIRERSKAERTLKETSRRMEMALRAGGMAAWEWTPKKSFWTPQLFEILGIPHDQKPKSELFFSLVHPDDIERLKSNWQAAVDGHDAYECEFRIIRPDGKIRWLTGVGEVSRDEEGKVARMYGVNWDCTKEHDQAAALRESERLAQAANASKSEFLANMSHEIRTPMTAILGYTELLSDFVAADEAKEHLKTIRRNGDYLLEIINDILDLSKIEAGKFEVEEERFDPTRVIEDVRSIMDVRARENGLELRVEYDGKLPPVIQSDGKRIKQILINLVGNAIKFTHEGHVRIRVWFERPTHQLHFDVIDTGIGMSQTQIDRLFKPFTQGDSSVTRHFGGTGLGLAISKRLAEMLGGEISVSSTETVGSTFAVSIATGKIADDDLVEPTEQIAEEETKQDLSDSIELTCHVLVVDDRRDIRFLSKHILTKAGATVDECEDGQLAMDYIKRCLQTDDLPDLILLDMQMPNLDGYQAARKLRNLGYTRPIIALTADAMQGDMNQCLQAGCNDYLSKPIDAARLLRLVDELTSS